METPLARFIQNPMKTTRKIQSYKSLVARLEVAASNHKRLGNVQTATELKNAIMRARKRMKLPHIARIIQQAMCQS